MILINSTDLLRLDLDGVHVLLPYLVTALEAVLPEREIKVQRTTSSHGKNELRRAGIKILVSMLALPSHFQNLPIKELVPRSSAEEPITFASLKPRLINLVINGLQVEEEACNTQILLGEYFAHCRKIFDLITRNNSSSSCTPSPIHHHHFIYFPGGCRSIMYLSNCLYTF